MADPVLVAPKTKPPLAAQILFAFGFVGLVFGLILSLAMLSRAPGASVDAFPVLSFFATQLGALLFALMVVGLFVLICFIRARKRWALIAYTIILALEFVATLFDWLTRSEFEKAFGSSNPGGTFLLYVLVGPLLVVLWTKNRKDFN